MTCSHMFSSAVDVLKATQQGVAPVRCGADADRSVIDCVRTGATWRIRLKFPCAAAMRPMSNYFDHLFRHGVIL